jgi:LacI family transcriptional regulator
MANLTLEDVARQAGVSRSTVSRVINGKPNVRPEVRDRVLQVIDETGYRPNLAARSLASQRSNLIGLVVPRSVQVLFTDPYYPRLIQGITHACNQHDQTLAFFLLHDQDQEERLYPRIVREGMLDGVIIQAAQTEDDLVARLVEARIPSVVAGRPVRVRHLSYVDVDNVSGAYSATSHLIRAGRQRIATVTGPLNTAVGQDRLRGFKNALNDRGLSPDDRLIVEGDFTEAGGYFATRRLLARPPDAIFVASDTMALGALRALREAGKAVPQDVAMVGYDDLPLAAHTTPPLTTVRQPIRRLGIRLVETLLDLIDNGPEPPRRVIFDTELVIRESCGFH